MNGFLFNQIKTLGTKIVGGGSPGIAAFAASLVVVAALCGAPTDAAAQVPHSGDINGDGVVNIYDAQCAVLLDDWDNDSDPYPGCAALPETMGSLSGADGHDMDCDQTNSSTDHQFTTGDTDIIIDIALSSPDANDYDPNYDGKNLFLHQNCRFLSCPYSNSGFTGLSAGRNHTCALDGSGAAWCWGDDSQGQLGNYDETTSPMKSPGQVGRAEIFKQIASNSSNGSIDGHTCGIRAAGTFAPLEDTLWCWGNNYDGQLGVGSSGNDFTLPVLVGSVDDKWDQVATGRNHTCAIRQESTGTSLRCWGDDSQGQLGLGSGDDSDDEPGAAVAEQSSSDWKLVTLGVLHSCAINEDEEAYCWGDNNYGQLGDSSTTDADSPQAVYGGSDWLLLATYYDTTCGIDDADALYCWGLNSNGALGAGLDPSSTTYVDEPTAVDSGNSYSDVWVGGFHACGITSGMSPRLRCWGRNVDGQLGYSTSPDTYADSPADVDSSPDWVFGIGGYIHTCAVKDDGGEELYCWGDGQTGQVGDGSTADNTTPGLVNDFALYCCGDSSCDSPEDEDNCSADCP